MKKFSSFCGALKEMHTKENWFHFSASQCRCRHWDNTCVRRCSLSWVEFVTSCTSVNNPRVGVCVSVRSCQPCDFSCSACTGPSVGDCIDCAPRFWWEIGACVQNCSDGYYGLVMDEQRLCQMYARCAFVSSEQCSLLAALKKAKVSTLPKFWNTYCLHTY